MRRIPTTLALAILVAPAVGRAQTEGRHASTATADTVDMPTPAEALDYQSYTDFDTMEAFLGRLADEAPELSVDTLALLPGEDPPGLADTPALVLIRLRRTGDSVGRRPAVLIIGSQHGDEQSGKEATLRLVRDVAVGSLNSILDAVDVYAVPMVNPWGTATGQRENADGLDLNRDHVRLASPAVSALHGAFKELDPAAVIDVHELGLAAYDAEIGLPTHPYADSSLIRFGRYRLMPYVANELARAGFTFHEYVTATPESSTGDNEEDQFFSYGPQLAAYARNAFALRGAVSMLFEVASSREIHDLARRTEVQTVLLRATLEALASMADELMAETARARSREIARADSVAAGTPPLIPLQAAYEADPRQPVLTWLVREPEGINTGSTDRWRPVIRLRLVVARPAGYLVPAGETDLIAALQRHGFELWELVDVRRMRVGRYPVLDLEAMSGRADDEIIWVEEDVPAGTVYIDLRQPAAALAAAILEPWSQDSWYAAEEREPAEATYSVVRAERSLDTGIRAVPPLPGDDILGGR